MVGREQAVYQVVLQDLLLAAHRFDTAALLARCGQCLGREEVGPVRGKNVGRSGRALAGSVGDMAEIMYAWTRASNVLFLQITHLHRSMRAE